eukprot:3502732-Amphidinium_carterae.1
MNGTARKNETTRKGSTHQKGSKSKLSLKANFMSTGLSSPGENHSCERLRFDPTGNEVEDVGLLKRTIPRPMDEGAVEVVADRVEADAAE